jgi:hypothetical protein
VTRDWTVDNYATPPMEVICICRIIVPPLANISNVNIDVLYEVTYFISELRIYTSCAVLFYRKIIKNCPPIISTTTMLTFLFDIFID